MRLVLLVREVLGERHALAQRSHAEGPPLRRVGVAAVRHRLLGGQRLPPRVRGRDARVTVGRVGYRIGDGRDAGGVGGPPGAGVRALPGVGVGVLARAAPRSEVRRRAGSLRYAAEVRAGRVGRFGRDREALPGGSVRPRAGVRRGDGVRLRRRVTGVRCGTRVVRARPVAGGPRGAGGIGGDRRPVRVGGRQGEGGPRSGLGRGALLGGGQRAPGTPPSGLLGLFRAGVTADALTPSAPLLPHGEGG